MNESIAENRYTLTKALFDEGMKRVSKENYAGFAKKVTWIVLAAWLIMAVLTVVLGQGYSLLLIESVVTAAVLLWINLYLPWDKRRRAWKTLSEQVGETSERTIRFTESGFTIETESRELSADYAEVQSVLETDRLYILLLENGTGILVDKQGFTVGHWADIVQLLQS